MAQFNVSFCEFHFSRDEIRVRGGGGGGGLPPRLLIAGVGGLGFGLWACLPGPKRAPTVCLSLGKPGTGAPHSPAAKWSAGGAPGGGPGKGGAGLAQGLGI